MSVLSRESLEASPLADLHTIAGELGLDGYRRLRKADLIDAILAGPGSTGLAQWSPIVISKQTLADLIAVSLYGLAFTLTVILWAVWQNRGQKKTDEVEKSTYGRPLVKA